MRVGIDLGGTKIEAIVLDDNNQTIMRERVKTPQGQYQATLLAIRSLVEMVKEKTGDIDSIGIGIPGAISRKTGLIKNANSVCLIGMDLKNDLEIMLSTPVKLANDANCFALSEAVDGAAKGAEVVFGVIIGTGCGGGLVVNEKIINGVNAISGEWGHNRLPWLEPDESLDECYCGLKGCTETFLSGSGFSQHYLKRTGDDLSAKQIVELANQGNHLAQEMLENYSVWLAKGLASVINVIDPDVIVLGGGMSNIDYLYQRVPQIWHQWIFSDQVETKLVPPKWGDSSGVRGAAWL